MYLPNLARINSETTNKLYVFPINGLSEYNPVAVLYHKDKEFPIYEKKTNGTNQKNKENIMNHTTMKIRPEPRQ